MAKRWILAVLLAWGAAQAPAHAQWGFNGQDADPRYDGTPADAATQVAANVPSLELNVDYLMWWLRDPRFAVPISSGVAGSPTVPGNGLDYDDPFAGARLAVRFWYDNTQTGSLEIAGLIVGENSSTIHLPNLTVSSTSKMWGAEVNLVVDTLWYGLELIGGFRLLDVQERVNIAAVVPPPPPQPPNGPNFILDPDQFATRNQFYGGQIGARASYRFGPVTAGAQAKIAFGGTNQNSIVSGFTTAAGGVTTLGVGSYTGPPNIGRRTKGVYSVLPEVEARLGLEVASGVILYASYDALWLTGALRPGDQIVGGPGAPAAVPFTDTHLWAQGLNFGLEVRY